jgi:hypothetical protein
MVTIYGFFKVVLRESVENKALQVAAARRVSLPLVFVLIGRALSGIEDNGVKADAVELRLKVKGTEKRLEARG